MSADRVTERRILRVSRGRAIAIGLSLGALGLGGYDNFVNIPAARDQIVREIPGCAELNMTYSQLREKAE